MTEQLTKAIPVIAILGFAFVVMSTLSGTATYTESLDFEMEHEDIEAENVTYHYGDEEYVGLMLIAPYETGRFYSQEYFVGEEATIEEVETVVKYFEQGNVVEMNLHVLDDEDNLVDERNYDYDDEDTFEHTENLEIDEEEKVRFEVLLER